MRLIDADLMVELIKAQITANEDDKSTAGMAAKRVMGRLIEFVNDLPTAQTQRKTGSWTEKHHAYADEEKVIEEWQSCKCSVCGRYDTRPYLYYFNEPHFCSWCGADMRRGDQDE